MPGTVALLAVAILALAGCGRPSAVSPPTVDRDQITQVSIINALMLGQYDGVMTIGELLRYGDFGLGTCDHLDGELIVLDGTAYQANADGTVGVLPAEATTPFAVITPFETDGQPRPCGPAASLTELEGHIDAALAQSDRFLAIRIEAEFESITYRSVPRQEPPYAALVDVAKKQTVWTHENVPGTLLAIRSPKWVAGLSVPGYHWHFISRDRKLGGHVLDCKFALGALRHDECDTWLIKLPESAGSGKDLSVDLSHDLEQVERLRGK